MKFETLYNGDKIPVLGQGTWSLGGGMTANASQDAESLQVLRSAIELYAAQHGDVAPGYESDNRSSTPQAEHFRLQTTVQERYMRKVPVNPFNNLNTILMIGNAETFPSARSFSIRLRSVVTASPPPGRCRLRESERRVLGSGSSRNASGHRSSPPAPSRRHRRS